jgi:PAS domain S-box-containing protein
MYVSSSGHPLRDEHNEPFGAVAVFRDISVHKQLEQELALYTKELEEKVRERTLELEQYLAVLHQEEAKEKALLESIGDGVIAVDKDRMIIYANQATEQMLGMSVQEMQGKPFVDMVPAQDEKGNPISASQRLLEQAAQSGKSMSQTYYYVRKNGSRFPVAVTASPIVLGGAMTGLVNTFRDITEEREIERAKDELVSLVSHQLRTPPTGIKWYAGMLLSEEVGAVNDMQRAYLREISYNNERMIDVVNAMLSVSRIELGKFVVEPKLTDITKLIEGVIGEIILHAEEKHLVITRKYPADSPSAVVDPTLVRMIVQNLLFNAVKYTPEKGKITIAYEVVGPELRLSVEDTGCGIPLPDQKNVFTKLYRADNARKIDSSGTGLGLYIVKRIINEMGGHIHFTS